MSDPHRAATAAPLVLALLVTACPSERSEAGASSASAGPSQKPVDRLAPDELAPGKREVFGLEVPRDMTVRGKFTDVAYLEGDMTPEALANYVRERVEVSHVEIGAARTVFPMARIKAAPADRFYQLEVIATGRRSELVIRDVTPKPRPPEENVSQEERWRRAGRAPDGRVLDINDLK